MLFLRVEEFRGKNLYGHEQEGKDLGKWLNIWQRLNHKEPLKPVVKREKKSLYW